MPAELQSFLIQPQSLPGRYGWQANRHEDGSAYSFAECRPWLNPSRAHHLRITVSWIAVSRECRRAVVADRRSHVVPLLERLCRQVPPVHDSVPAIRVSNVVARDARRID